MRGAVRQSRIDLGITQKELGESIGLHNTSIEGWELYNTSKPSMVQQRGIMEAFGCAYWESIHQRKYFE